ncbi:MAG: class I SAM-dependent methyltransferase [Thermoanaerobaculia bacterium]|nr:class I SAM-dependent methyltransferase [Thermoanaerobaculia bacterium]
MKDFDYGRYSEDYAEHRPGPPASLYDRIERFAPIRGSRILDLATGPGLLALELGARGGSVVGIDLSPEQIFTARRVAESKNLDSSVRFQIARAERVGLEPSTFDLVTAGQSWHWFDREAVMGEVRRLLRPGGILAIVYYSYLAEHSAAARDTEKLIRELNPSWDMHGWNGMYPEYIDGVIRGGFQFVEAFCYDNEEDFSHLRWRRRIRTCGGVGSGDLSPSEVERFDEALKKRLKRSYPDPMVIDHRVWCVVARNPE